MKKIHINDVVLEGHVKIEHDQIYLVIRDYGVDSEGVEYPRYVRVLISTDHPGLYRHDCLIRVQGKLQSTGDGMALFNYIKVEHLRVLEEWQDRI